MKNQQIIVIYGYKVIEIPNKLAHERNPKKSYLILNKGKK